MPGYATLRVMGAADFRAEVKRRRKAQRLARTALALRSGISAAAIEKIEMREPPVEPERETVIDLARALSWDVDEALGTVGYEPITEDERAQLGRINSPREQLDRLLDELPAAVVTGLLALVRSILNPRAVPQDIEDDSGSGGTNNPGGVNVQDVEPGSGDVLGVSHPVLRRHNS